MGDRIEKQIGKENIGKIESKGDFIQQMVARFFKGATNPRGFTGKHLALANEMFEYFVVARKFDFKKIPPKQQVQAFKREALLSEVALRKGIVHENARRVFAGESTQQLGRRLGGLRRWEGKPTKKSFRKFRQIFK